MAFDDLPEIDQSAKNSGLSERRFMDLLNQQTGFICRTDVPDKGCDFDVELILENTGASNWRFPTQLKSIEEMTIIDDDRFISYPFKTSRLGYLMKRRPAMGLIVLYDVEHDRLYYDFADEAYKRLCLARESDDWKKQDFVNIHIPINNLLTAESVPRIHSIFANRFTNGEKMQEAHGKQYGLPTMHFTNATDYDFTKPEDVKRFLGDYGMLMLGNYDLDILFEMISSLPNAQLYGNKALMFIAAIVYGETGLYADSGLFLEKLKRSILSESEKLSLQFVDLKNRLALGYISIEKFLSSLSNLSASGKNDADSIIIELNILRYELGNHSSLEKKGAALLEKIEVLFDHIDRAAFNGRQKALMTLWNMENLSFVVNHITLEKTGEIHIKESLGAIIPLEEKRRYVLETLRTEHRFTERINQINRIAEDTKDDLLKAYSMALHVHHFTQKLIPLLSYGKQIDLMRELIPQINLAVSAAASAYNIFYKQHLYKDAYNSLCGMIEMQQFGLAHFPDEFSQAHSLHELLEVKKQMEEQLALSPFQFILQSIHGNDPDGKEDHNLSFTANLSDDEIATLSEYMQQSLQLPLERIGNIKQELISYRLFNQRCKDKNILLLTFKSPYEQQHPYALPTRFVLRNKQTQLETIPSSDMEVLLQSIKW